MKKTIVLLLSLILLFSFVSCNGSTNSPSDSGSSNKPTITVPTAPVDTNASSAPKYNATNDEGKILNVFTGLEGVIPDVFENEQDGTGNYELLSDKTINGKSISGSFSVRRNYSSKECKSQEIFNGTIKIGKNEYKLSNFAKIHTWSTGSDFNYSGSITVKDSSGNQSTITKFEDADDDIKYFINNYNHEIAKMTSAQNLSGGIYVEYKGPNVVGKYSVSVSSTNSAMVTDVIVNFEKITVSKDTHSLTARYKMLQNFGSGMDVDIEYASVDGTYYTPESIKNNKEIFPKLYYIIAN